MANDFQFQPIKPKTPEMEQLLSVGYDGMTVETAKQIIKERDQNPALWPFEEYQKAKMFLKLYNADLPKPTSPHVGTLGRRIEDME